MQRAEEALRQNLVRRADSLAVGEEIGGSLSSYGPARVAPKSFRYAPEARRARPPSLAELAKRVKAQGDIFKFPGDPAFNPSFGGAFAGAIEPIFKFDFDFDLGSDVGGPAPSVLEDKRQPATTSRADKKKSKSQKEHAALVIDVDDEIAVGATDATNSSSSSSAPSPFPSFLERVPLMEAERLKEAKASTLSLLDYMLLLRTASAQADITGEASYDDFAMKVRETGKAPTDIVEQYIADYHAAKAAEAAALGVPPLTDEERALAERALDRKAPKSEVLSSKFKMDITRDNLMCLQPTTWLNDEVINFWFKMLQERCDGVADGPSCYFSNSFFWNTLSGGPEKENKKYNYDGVKRWTTRAKVDIFAKDYMLFPMNIGNMHWAMGVIDFKNKGFRYYDSMLSSPHPNFVPFLKKYLSDEHKAKKGKELADIDDWKLIQTSPPQQKNTWDCGVFTCTFADFFCSERQFNFGQENMGDLRLRIAATVVRGSF